MKRFIYQNRSRLLIFLLFTMCSIVYLPYIINGGFIIDDWGVIRLSYYNKGFWQSFTNWFPLFSNRPLAPILLSITGNLFCQWTMGYILTNLFFWFSTLLIIALVLKKYLNEVFSYLFVAFAMIPVFASTVIFSPVMQITGTVSLFLWACSFYTLNKYLEAKKIYLYLITYLFLIIAMLIYEIILPLLLITICFPIYVGITKNYRLNPKKNLHYLIKYVIPILLLLFGIFIYQKIIMPKYMTVYSRFNFFALGDNYLIFIFGVIKIIISWFRALFIFFPVLLFSSILYFGTNFFNRFDLLFLSIIVLTLYILLNQRIYRQTISTNKTKYLFGVILLSFIGSIFLYILAGSSPNISGYDNRGLSSTWIIVSMVLAYIGYFFHGKKESVIIYLLLLLCMFSFVAQRDNYIQSYQLQKEMVFDIAIKVENAHIPNKIVVLGHVPKYLLKNFNGEEVFNNPWDFGAALNLITQGAVVSGNTITSGRIKKSSVEINSKNILIEGWWNADISNLWFYEYDQDTRKSSFIKVKDSEHLRKIIKNVENNNINNPQMYYKKLMLKNFQIDTIDYRECIALNCVPASSE